MKTMTCNQLGGACDASFSAETFEEMANICQEHGKEMFLKQDPAHLEAIQAMQVLMQDPEKMQQWFEGKREEFLAAPDDK